LGVQSPKVEAKIVYSSLVDGSDIKSTISCAIPGTPVIFNELRVVDGGLVVAKLKLEVVLPPATNICGVPLLQL
jgi:hypothetical protein